jgi:hypothetical protein
VGAGDDAQEHQQRTIQPPEHFRGASALFAGYVDDKAKLLLLAAVVGRKGDSDSIGSDGSGVQVLYALKERARAFPQPQTPRARAGDGGGEAAAGGAQADMDTSE